MTSRCAFLLLAGCGFFESGTTPTPPPDAGPSPCENPGVECATSELCNQNNHAETCYRLEDPAVCRFAFVDQEECDGTDVTSCRELGYYDGAVSCDNCKVNASGCHVCAGGVSCTTVNGFSLVQDPAVSGDYVALGGVDSVVIFLGLTEVTQVAIPDLQALAGVPGGWLVATNNPPSLSTLDYAGVRGSSHPLPAGVEQPFMVSNAGGRVIVIWEQPVFMQQYMMFAIADADGNIIVPPTGMFPKPTGAWSDATSDGTSFFVGSGGTLARVSETGTVTTRSGFETGYDHLDLAWNGTTGWYVGSSYGFDAQRFDINGAPVGTDFYDLALPDCFDFLGDGDDLVAAQADVLADAAMWVVVLRRFSPSGAITEQHIGALGPSWWARAAHIGAAILVVWNFGDTMTLALVP